MKMPPDFNNFLMKIQVQGGGFCRGFPELVPIGCFANDVVQDVFFASYLFLKSNSTSPTFKGNSTGLP